MSNQEVIGRIPDSYLLAAADGDLKTVKEGIERYLKTAENETETTDKDKDKEIPEGGEKGEDNDDSSHFLTSMLGEAAANGQYEIVQ